MKSKTIFFIVIAAVVLVAVLVYVWLHSKAYYSGVIIKRGGHHNRADLMSFETGYLQAWANALKKGLQVFSYKGTDYKTVGGKLA